MAAGVTDRVWGLPELLALGDDGMAKKKIVVLGKSVKVGERMATGKGWRLISPGKRRTFRAELVARFDGGLERAPSKVLDLALFRIY